MARYQPTKQELDQAYADVEPHWPAIIRTNERMMKILMKLPDIAQKQALCMMAATWVMAHRTDDDQEGLDLVDALREQINLNLVAAKDAVN
jgi:hypothetical protein